MARVARSARTRRLRAATVAVAVGVGGLAVAAIIGRPGAGLGGHLGAGLGGHLGAGPVRATVAVGPWAWGSVPAVGVDEALGRAYIATTGGGGGSGIVRVLDTTTGALVGTASLPGRADGGLFVAVDARRGRAYVASGGSTTCGAPGLGGAPQACATVGAALATIDGRTGRVLRSLPVDAGIGLAVDGRTGLLYALPAGGTTDRVRVIDPRSGRAVRTIALPGSGQGLGFGALATDGRGQRLVIVRNPSGPAGRSRWSADVIDLARGTLLRHIPLPGAGDASPLYPPLVDAARGRAYVGLGNPGAGAGGAVAVLDIRHGALLRATATGAGIGGLAEDARAGRVFTTALGTPRMVMTRLRGGGVVIARMPAGMGAFQGLALTPAGTGTLQAVDARTGAPLRGVPLGVGMTDVAVDERRGRVYALSTGAADARGGLTRRGTLVVVDERTWRVMRTLAVGAAPVALALDRRHDRLLVACAGPSPGVSGGTPEDPWGWLPGPVRHLLPFLPRPPAPPATPQGSVLVLDTTRL
jgi:DNA-binding beta-propeller fold protein YncE